MTKVRVTEKEHVYLTILRVFFNKNGEEDDYQTIVLEPEIEENEEREKRQSDKIDLEINKDIPVPIIID